MLKSLKSTFNSILDVILPPLCPVTREAVANQGDIHPTLWKELNFITAPMCERCGVAFPVADKTEGKDALCGLCLRSPPQYTTARSLFIYKGKIRDMILSFKHGDKTQYSPVFAKWMIQQYAPEIEAADLIMPVPVHKKRLIKRRFNQSALIAKELSRMTDKPAILNNGLIRTKHTPPQSGNYNDRRLNVKKVFAVHDDAKDTIKDKNILLIDDVLTTGATLNSCADELLETGAKSVNCLTIARVVRN